MKKVQLSDVQEGGEAGETGQKLFSEENPGSTPFEEFRVGKALSQTFDTLFANFFSFTLIGILVFMPIVAFAIWFTGGVAILQGDITQGGFTGLGLTSLGTMVFTQVAYAAIICGAVSYLSGDKMAIGRMITGGFSAVLPVIAVSIMVAVLTVLGYIVLIIPGIIISMMLAVAVPAVVAEKRGIVEALSRSADLTKGYRWGVLGTFIVVGIITAIANWLVSFVQISVAAAVDDLELVLIFVLTVVTYGLTTALSGAATSAIYVQLRECKEGTTADEIAEVFS